jgi:hypothetical protein
MGGLNISHERFCSALFVLKLILQGSVSVETLFGLFETDKNGV